MIRFTCLTYKKKEINEQKSILFSFSGSHLFDLFIGIHKMFGTIDFKCNVSLNYTELTFANESDLFAITHDAFTYL